MCMCDRATTRGIFCLDIADMIGLYYTTRGIFCLDITTDMIGLYYTTGGIFVLI